MINPILNPLKKPSLTELVYETQTLLVSFYSQAQSNDHRPEGKRLWQKGMDTCLVDLEHIHEIFALRNQEIKYGMYLPENFDLNWHVKRFYQRVLTISNLINSWTYLKKVAAICLSLETKWAYLLKETAKNDNVDKDSYLKIASSAEERSRILKRISELYEDEEKASKFFDPLIFDWNYL